MIKELIVVEGKNDAEVIRRAFPDADVMITNGWGLSQAQIKALQRANQRRGVIIFTDPDHAGDQIRRRLSKLLPGARHAFVPKDRAVKDGKVGVEAASIQDVSHALTSVRTEGEVKGEFTNADMVENRLTAIPAASIRRRTLGALLSIGYGNSKTFLWRLNALGVTREEFTRALEQMEAEFDGCNQTN
jgi:ribonuclease M5